MRAKPRRIIKMFGDEMADKKIQRGKTLGELAYEALYQYVRDMNTDDNRLPSEEELSREFGVSRAIIREACNRLVAEGYISKSSRCMLGHPSAFKLKNRIDLISDFKVLLSNNHKNVGLTIQNVHMLEPPITGSVHQWQESDGEVFSMTWVYTTDEKPVIYGIFELPVSALSRVPEKDFLVEDLPEFSRLYFKTQLDFCAMNIGCDLDPEIARLFGVCGTRPLQRWNETLISTEDKPLGYSAFYLHPDDVVMSVLTKFKP